MATYTVVAHATISMTTVVEAESEAEAREAAEGASMMRLCWQCGRGAGSHLGEWRTSGELDGEPEIVEVYRDE